MIWNEGGTIMNYREQNVLLHQRGVAVHRNLLLALFTSIIIILCALIGSNIVASSHSKAAQNASTKYYTSIEIEKGDTLWSIAESYITPEYPNTQAYVEEIKEINNLGDDDIHSGQYLMIPYFSSENK